MPLIFRCICGEPNQLKFSSCNDLSTANPWILQQLGMKLVFGHATEKVILIFADPFLPRVVELATTSSDRQTKASDVYAILYITQ